MNASLTSATMTLRIVKRLTTTHARSNPRSLDVLALGLIKTVGISED
jgi:hypothetical protein